MSPAAPSRPEDVKPVFILKNGESVFSRYFTTVEDAHVFARSQGMPEPVAQWTYRLLEA